MTCKDIGAKAQLQLNFAAPLQLQRNFITEVNKKLPVCKKKGGNLPLKSLTMPLDFSN